MLSTGTTRLRSAASGLSCAGCGGQLARTDPSCPACGAPNPVGLQEGTLEQLRKYIPQGVMEAILEAGQELATQRREVTVLFADVSGFTSLSDGRDPEDVVLIMNQCFEGLVEAVHAQGGTVDKFIGDCVMAVFGAPVAHEDDPPRAVRAALGMLASLEGLNRTLPIRLDLRVGINAGPVVAGTVGSSTRLNYTVMGDTVNVAQRLEAAAEVGKILVSESVYKASRDTISFKPLPPLRVKGKKHPMQVYEALRPKDQVEPLALVDFVGRVRERQILEAAGQAVRQGRGAALLICGEPGIGKSALLQQAADAYGAAGLRPHLIRARLHSGDSGGFAGLISALLGCEAGPDEGQLRRRLDALAPQGLDAIDQQVLTHLTAAAELKLPEDTAQLAIATAVRRLFRLTARSVPTAILIDDVHRLPERERVLLEVGAAVCAEAPLLLVATDRESTLSSWPHQRFQRLQLDALDELEAERLVKKRASGRPVADEVFAKILKFAGGNPLFLEETVRLLDAQGALVADTPRGRRAEEITVPDGLRPLVLARFDRLDAGAKRALIYGAVIGRSFTLGLLSRLAGEARTLASVLQALCEQGLLEPESRPGGPGPVRLRFRHEVVREILYQLITVKTRRAIHGEVATLLQAGAGAEAAPEETAHHLEQAGRDAEAADLWERAGNDRVTRHELLEAAQFLGLGVAALDRARSVGIVRRTDDTERALALRLKWARALNRASRWDEARRVALEARQGAQEVGNLLFVARATQELAVAAAAKAGLTEADSLFREAQQAALECGDLMLAAELASERGEVLERQGNLPLAASILLEAQEMLEGAARRTATPSTGHHAELLNRLGRVALRAGDHQKAMHCFRVALGEAQSAGDAALAARVLGNLGQTQALGPDKLAALETVSQALESARRLGDRLAEAKLLYNQARLYRELGRLPPAEAAARGCFQLSLEIGWREGEAMSTAALEQLGRPPERRLPRPS